MTEGYRPKGINADRPPPLHQGSSAMMVGATMPSIEACADRLLLDLVTRIGAACTSGDETTSDQLERVAKAIEVAYPGTQDRVMKGLNDLRPS